MYQKKWNCSKQPVHFFTFKIRYMKTESVFSQRELAEGTITGDGEILQEVKRIMLQKIKGMLVNRKANYKLLDQKAADIYQDALYGYLAAVKANTYHEQGQFLSFLMEIASNAAYKNFHGQKKLGEEAIIGNENTGERIDHLAIASCNFFDTFQEAPLDLEELIDVAYSSSDKHNLLRLIQLKSSQLKPKHKVVFDLWIEGYSLAKTAEILSLSIGNVKVIRTRLRDKLRTLCN